MFSKLRPKVSKILNKWFTKYNYKYRIIKYNFILTYVKKLESKQAGAELCQVPAKLG